MPAGVTARWTAPRGQLGDDRQRGDDDRGAEPARRRRRPSTLMIGSPSVTHAGQRRDRRGGDDVDRRRLDAAEDQRQRERQLDPADDLRAGHAHAARGVDRVAVDLAHPHVGVGEDRRDGEQHERERHVREPDAEVERDEERDQRQARHGAADVGGVDREERRRGRCGRAAARAAARSAYAMRHRGERQLEVLPQQRRRYWRPPTGRPRAWSRALKMNSIASPNSPRTASVMLMPPPARVHGVTARWTQQDQHVEQRGEQHAQRRPRRRRWT